ncbi:hypothetical protein GCM10010401_12720 [Rarobacter faecitabidus]|uniref:Putative regulator of septum formation n=1 Tax=Rarobacter faecitabidus TaxID=13243 RepID=A0A542Z8M2_RARFA|nr:septum formation family protein [Rarobacter faecitabidus]TQL56665.1 putative regulator of septum formation [Rarobacter faecitabidus]
MTILRMPARPGRMVALLAYGLVALILAGVLGVWATGVLLARENRLPVRVTHASHARADQLAPGHCLKTLPEDGTVGVVVVVPCDQAHKAQVIKVWELPGEAGARPSANSWQSEIDYNCNAGMLSDAPADLGFVVWIPTQSGWESGDRRAVCLAEATALTSSLLG